MTTGGAAIVESCCSVQSFIREFSSSRLMVLCILTSSRCLKNNLLYSVSNFLLRVNLGIMSVGVEGR